MIVQKIMHKGFMDKYTNNIIGKTMLILSDIDYSNYKCLIIYFRCRLRTSAVLLVSWVLPPCWKACECVILLWSMDPKPMQVQMISIHANLLLKRYNQWVIKHIFESFVTKCIIFIVPRTNVNRLLQK